VCGEFLEVPGSADGFGEALRSIAARAGSATPELATLPPVEAAVRIYPAGPGTHNG